jgi:Rieske 2Fe-2S family protein
VVGLVNYPNFWMDAISDYVWTMRVTPVNAETTDIEFCWLVDANAEEGKDYTTERLTEFWELPVTRMASFVKNNFTALKAMHTNRSLCTC